MYDNGMKLWGLFVLAFTLLVAACGGGVGDPVGTYSAKYTSNAGDVMTVKDLTMVLKEDKTYEITDKDLKIAGKWSLEGSTVTFNPESFSGDDRAKAVDPRAKPNKMDSESGGKELNPQGQDGAWGYTVWVKQ